MLLVCANARADMLETQPVHEGLARIVSIVNARDGSNRLFLATQDGRILVRTGAGVLLPMPFLDISSLVSQAGFEEGLLSLAFHPNFASNRRFYVYYTNLASDNVLVRYQASATNPNVADPASASLVLGVPHPGSTIHNGGGLGFGPDGFLYLGVGEAGQGQNAQNLGLLLGKIHRLDVNGAAPYTIPPDNPFIGTPGARPEIWAYGLRNPWRLTFDRGNGDLWISDVGFKFQDEIDHQLDNLPGGRNYGWPFMEGTYCWNTPCPSGLTPPVTTQEAPNVLAAGYRYRGNAMPLLQGMFLYGGWGSGMIWGARQLANGSWESLPLLDSPHPISAFGEDESGELYVADYGFYGSPAGLYRLVAADTPPVVRIDTNLTTAGVYEGEGPYHHFDYPVRLETASLTNTVTVQYAAVGGTATAGVDYTATAGTLTFAPGETSKVVRVEAIDDPFDEEDAETFTFVLSAPVNATLGQPGSLPSAVGDDDPPPGVGTADRVVTEGNTAGPACTFPVVLEEPSALTIRVFYRTENLTALSGQDYQEVSGWLTFPPGDLAREVVVPLIPDGVPEDNEDFEFRLLGGDHVTLAFARAICSILDDDVAPIPGRELAHGSVLQEDLVGGSHGFRILQAPRSSYEVIVDGTSGDVTPGLAVQRYAADNATVLQGGEAVGTGSSVSLRWQNTTAAAVVNQHLRVRSGGCIAVCGPDDVYRVRVFDTTYRAARFNNGAGQVSVMIVQNPTGASVHGTAWFWDAEGALLYRHFVELAPRATSTLDTSAVAALAGRHGSVTLSHDAPYGALAAKILSLDPAGGFSFDAPFLPRPR